MILFILFILFIVCVVTFNENNFFSLISSLLIGSLFFASLIIWPINYIGISSEVKEFISVQETLTNARLNPNISSLELAAIQRSVVDSNKWLANVQYWNDNIWFGVFYPNSVSKLKPIR